MRHTHSSRRQAASLFSEHRLTYDHAPATEIGPEQIVDRVSDTLAERDSEEKAQTLSQLMQRIEENADQTVIQSALQERLSRLDPTLVQRNLDALRARATERKEVRERHLDRLEELMRQVVEQNGAKPREVPDPAVKTQQIDPTKQAAASERGFMASLKLKGAEWAKEIEGWSWQKKALVATATVGGLYAGYRLLKWMFAGKEKPESATPPEDSGFLSWKKWLPWVPGLGLLAAVGFGGYALYTKFSDRLDAVKQASNTAVATVQNLASTANAVNDGVAGAVDAAVDIGTPVVNTATELAKTVGLTGINIVNGKPNEAMQAFLQHGVGFVQNGVRFFAVYGGKHIELAGDLMQFATSYFTGSQGPKDAAGKEKSFWTVYGAAGVLYVLDAAAFSKLMTGNSGLIGKTVGGTLGNVAGKVAAWPAYLAHDGIQWSRIILSGDGRLIVNKLQGVSIPFVPGTRAAQMRDAIKALKTIDASQVTSAFEQFIRFRNVLEEMERRPLSSVFRIGYSEAEVAVLKHRISVLAEKIHAALMKVDPATIPADASDVYKEAVALAHTHGDKKVFAEELAKKVKPASAPTPAMPAGNRSGAAKTVSNPSAAANGTGDLGDISRTGDALDDMPNPAAVKAAQEKAALQELLGDSDIARKVEGMAEAERNEVTKQLKRLTYQEWEMIRSSEGATKLVKGALLADDAVGEVTRISKAAKAGTMALKGGLLAVNVAGDVFGVVMAYYDWKANGERIVATTNPELRDLYQNAYVIPIVEGGVSATGLALTGLAFVPGMVGQAAGAVAASMGTIMLPVGMAIASFRYTHGALTESAAANLADVNDYMRMQSEELLEKLIQLSKTNTEDTAGRSLVRSLTGVSKQDEEQTFNEQRARILEAYVRKTNGGLPQKMARNPDGSLRPETQQEYQNRFAGYIRDQVLYVARLTRGTYQLRNTSLLEEAQTYADLLQFSSMQKVLTTRGLDGSVRTIDLSHLSHETDPRALRQSIDAYQQNILEQSSFDQITRSAEGDPAKAEDAIIFLLRHHLALFRTKTKMIAARDGSHASKDMEEAQRLSQEVSQAIKSLAADMVKQPEREVDKHRQTVFQFQQEIYRLGLALDAYKENDALFWKLSSS